MSPSFLWFLSPSCRIAQSCIKSADPGLEICGFTLQCAGCRHLISSCLSHDMAKFCWDLPGFVDVPVTAAACFPPWEEHSQGCRGTGVCRGQGAESAASCSFLAHSAHTLRHPANWN